jgi:hypothetical protein
MNFTKTFESPFTVSYARRFLIDENFLLSSETKLLGFLKLQPGWNNGRGQPISHTAFRAALRLLRDARGGIIEKTDVFPRADGGVTVAVYYSGRDLAFNVKPDGTVDIDSETEADFPILEGLSETHALFIVQGLRQWNWSSSFTFRNMMKPLTRPGFEALVSRSPATERVFRSSFENVPREQRVPYVLMPGRSMAA